jgi:pimeloyl-ACP methyl ester carboxylesterase
VLNEILLSLLGRYKILERDLFLFSINRRQDMQGMRLLVSWKWVGFLFLLFVGTGAAAETPLEVYGRLPTLENVSLSPGGTRIAYVKGAAGERIVYIFSFTDKKILGALRVGQVKLRDIIWADDDHILLVESATGLPMGLVGARSEFFMLVSYDVRTGKSYDPISSSRSKDEILNAIIGQPMIRRINDQTIVYVEGIYVTDHTMPALFKLNLTTGYSDIVERGTDKSRGWLVDDKGDIVAAQTYDENKQKWGLLILKDRKLTEISSGETKIEYPTIAGFSPSDNDVWVSTVEKHLPEWKSISLKSGVMGDTLQNFSGFESLMTDPYTDHIVGGYKIGSSSGLIFLDDSRQKAWENLREFLAGERVSFVSASRDYQKIMVLIDGPRYGYAYYLYDIASVSLQKLGNVYDDIKQVAEVRSFEYTAGDGLKIPSFLTLPPKREAKNLPLVVLPHGGPASRDTGSFDWWAQALASQGYAVLQPNYRGSDLGWEFMSAGFGEMGRKMQTDLSDGVRQLVKDGTVDANRVCIVGASYGGYAALAGAALETGIYRCAVSVGGISDLRKYLKWVGLKQQQNDSSERRYWDRYYGATGPDDPILKTISPLEQVNDVTIPILLIHGRDDTVVPFEQSELMADALKKAKKSVELVKLKNEDHWLSRSDTRLQMLQETVRFLLEHNPPD